ncbi:MAG: bifunctional 4-hydroxy-2-oxoglutarate aldolase/2-dehydro-3-deoxy-phosphogluconate aldolase [Angelakisella sp.]|nr:bifunctional 4-hydroxy-2-oxoglutarate aldolase/2-dehydro-3-deoxy-phosphogluconate aldolase [Angelakisella sp.]
MDNTVYRKLYENGVVPVVVLEKADDAVPLARALLKGGVRVAEITFRTTAAPSCIAAISAQVPEMTVGAGTVTSIKMAQDAVAAGAQFIVSPGYDEEVVKWCMEQDVTVYPGVSNPSEIQAAIKLGLTALKLFPAQQLGGAKYIRSLSGIYRNISFMPSGGISLDNMNEYFDVPSVFACGGSWVCPEKLIQQGRWDEITAICEETVAKMHHFFLLHIGVNSKDENEARETATDFSTIFGLQVQELPGAFFAGTMMEVVKKPFLGEHGHIAISTNNIDRAIAFFKSRGYTFRDNMAQDEQGIIAAYFEKEIAGYAIHLRRKL